MKFLSVVWACYVLVLSCLPCTHHHEAAPRPNAVASLRATAAEPTTTSHEPQAPDPEKNHACSPFCTCACGAASVLIPASVRWLPPAVLSFVPAIRRSFSYTSPRLTTPIVSIWQPPKLSV